MRLAKLKCKFKSFHDLALKVVLPKFGGHDPLFVDPWCKPQKRRYEDFSWMVF